MKRYANRWISLMVVLMLMLGVVPGAMAAGEAWTCPGCGQEGNTGNFCPNCGTARPDASWTCPTCGQQGNEGNYCTNCATPRPTGNSPSDATTSIAKASTANSETKVNTHLEQIPGETDRVKVLVKAVTASSYIENAQEPTLWVPENAADGDESTCWQFSTKGKTKLSKTWLDLDFGSSQTIHAIWFKNGFWAYGSTGKDQYPINARPKQIIVEFLYKDAKDYADPIEITLEDDKQREDWQRFDLGKHTKVQHVRIRVITVYKGSQFPNDVCLSEVMMVRNAKAETAMEPQATKEPTVYVAQKVPSSANLLMKLATRSGPGTEYEEPGTFFSGNWQDQTVRVTKKFWDGSIWWVEVDFAWKNQRYRVWTGAKRVDVDLDLVKTTDAKKSAGKYAYLYETDTWRGPGTNYAKGKPLQNEQGDVKVRNYENGFYEVDFFDEMMKIQRRCWVPEGAVELE